MGGLCQDLNVCTSRRSCWPRGPFGWTFATPGNFSFKPNILRTLIEIWQFFIDFLARGPWPYEGSFKNIRHGQYEFREGQIRHMFTSHSSYYKFSPIWDWKEPSWYNLQLINPWNVSWREWNGGGNNCIMRDIKALSILKFALLRCCTGHKNVPKVWIKMIGMPWWSNLHTQLAQKLSTRKEKYGHEEQIDIPGKWRFLFLLNALKVGEEKMSQMVLMKAPSKVVTRRKKLEIGSSRHILKRTLCPLPPPLAE